MTKENVVNNEDKTENAGQKHHKENVSKVFQNMVHTINSDICRNVIQEGGAYSDGEDYNTFCLNLEEKKATDIIENDYKTLNKDNDGENMANVDRDNNNSVEFNDNFVHKDKSTDSRSTASNINNQVVYQANVENRSDDSRQRNQNTPSTNNRYSNAPKNDYPNQTRNSHRDNRNDHPVYRNDGSYHSDQRIERRNDHSNQRNQYDSQRSQYDYQRNQYDNQRSQYDYHRNSRNAGYEMQSSPRNDNRNQPIKRSNGNQRNDNGQRNYIQNGVDMNQKNYLIQRKDETQIGDENYDNRGDYLDEERGRNPKRQDTEKGKKSKKSSPIQSQILSRVGSQKITPVESRKYSQVQSGKNSQSSSTKTSPVVSRVSSPILNQNPQEEEIINENTEVQFQAEKETCNYVNTGDYVPSSEIFTVINQMMAVNIQSTTTTTRPKNNEILVDKEMLTKLLVNTLPSYDGKSDPKIFLTQLDSLYQINQFNANQLAEIIDSKLTGIANNWFTIYTYQQQFIYSQFRASFNSQFMPNPVLSLINLKQNDELHVFLMRFQAFVIGFNLQSGNKLNDYNSLLWLINAIDPQHRSKILGCSGLEEALIQLK